MPSRDDWEKVIIEVVNTLDNAKIEYHIDASSSLYVHGIDFDMDDLDITVKWGDIEKSYQGFKKYSPTKLDVNYPPSFKFEVDGNEVHIMSYESPTGLGEPNDRLKIQVNNCDVWSKTIDFYERHMRHDHPLKQAVINFHAGKGL